MLNFQFNANLHDLLKFAKLANNYHGRINRQIFTFEISWSDMIIRTY